MNVMSSINEFEYNYENYLCLELGYQCVFIACFGNLPSNDKYRKQAYF